MPNSRQHRLPYQNYLELSRILSVSRFICQIQGEKVKKRSLRYEFLAECAFFILITRFLWVFEPLMDTNEHNYVIGFDWVCFLNSYQSSVISNQLRRNRLERFGQFWNWVCFAYFYSPQIAQIVTDINITTEDDQLDDLHNAVNRYPARKLIRVIDIRGTAEQGIDAIIPVKAWIIYTQSVNLDLRL